MSRSLWAWTKSCAVGAARCGLAPNQVQAHLGYGRVVLTVSSLTPLISVVAAFTVTLAFSPAALGKVGTPHARPLAGPAHGGAPSMYAALSHNSRKRDTSPGAGHLAHGRTASPVGLAYGSGFSAHHGSPAVRALQRRLAGLGYQPGPIDGRYGPLTEAAVMRFQATHRLKADGIAGVRTLAVLAVAKPVLYPGEGYGPTGSRTVRSLQRRLAAARFSPGPIDGRYGPLTERAVTRFQSARHLRPDGIAGPQTLDQLGAVHSRPTHLGQHHVPPKGSAGRRQTTTAPTQPSRAAHQATPGAHQARQSGRHSAAFPLIWVIVLAGLLLAFLASSLRHRRRGGDADSGARAVEPGGQDRLRPAAPPTRARADVPENTPVSAGAPEGAAGSSAPENGGQGTGQQDGATAFGLGLRLAQEGDRVGAEDAFRRADECGHADAAFELGVMLVQEGDGAGAKDAFWRADRRGHPGAAFDLGTLLLQEGDLAGAREAFRRAEKRGHPDAAFDLGALLLQEGDHAGAEDAFRRADKHGDGAAACNLGVLLEQRGDVVGAKEAYQRADTRGHRVGACNLGALLEQQGDVVAARKAYRRADQRGDSDGAYHLGTLLELEGDRAAAKDAYRRAAQRGHPEGACKLGLLLRDEGDRDGAAQAFRRAGERGSPEIVKVARAALLELDRDEEDGR